MSRVLALRALGLGDALTAVPALRGLRRAFADAELILAGPAALGEWLRGFRLVDTVVAVDGVSRLPTALPDVGSVDVAVNLHGRGPESTALLAATRLTRLISFGDAIAWRSDEHEVERWCRLVRSTGVRSTAADLILRDGAHDGPVVCHPGAAAPSRRWPVDRWAAVVRGLVADGEKVVVTGTAAERQLCAEVAGVGAENVAGTLDLADLTELVAEARMILCGDTGVAHLANACRTPSVVLFGPVSPAQWGPAIDVDRHRVLWHGQPEAPGDPHGHSVDPALAQISVTEVVQAARLLARNRITAADQITVATRGTT